jgi:flagellar biosynthetic protein FlhB
MLGGALAAFSMTMGTAARDVGGLATSIFSQLASARAHFEGAPHQLNDSIIVLGKVLLPIIGASILAALLSGGLQSRFSLTPQALGFKLENLDIMNGLGRVFSKGSLVHGAVDLIKIVAIGLVLWTAARGLLNDPLFSAPIEAAYLGQFFGRATIAFISRLIFALAVVAAISYWYEFFKSKRELMMTREEVKEERRQSDGDPVVKGAMKRMARRLLQKQMLAAVPTADVVITNPTHYAVALKYERGIDQAPVVLAKGENRFAFRIKELARQNEVPIIENKPVARMLYALGRVDQAIPTELYQAVAEILAFVYRTHRYYFYRLKARRAEEVRNRRTEPRAAASAHPSLGEG